MSALEISMRYMVLVLMTLLFVQCRQGSADAWTEDFAFQPVSSRPALEVNYTDATRTAFQVLAEEYQLVGQLIPPNLLMEKNNKPWLWMEVEDGQGKVFSTKWAGDSTRINLYRRGPYFCELHWFDLQVAAENGEPAPLKGDLTLYCYPEKILAEITWHATEDFEGSLVRIEGIAPTEFVCTPFVQGTKQSFAFPMFGEEEPLSEEAFHMLEGEVPMRYNARKGYYEIGTNTSASFEDQMYDFPNRYETATFRLKNDNRTRKIYIGHKSVVGGGIVEGGAILNEQGQNMPLLVQVSKNFAGEKEEKFYNPDDTAFSETFFPLYLEPGEEMTLSSLHLYQNYGRHMTKHWSSLGAWMDYFHSSTGVTETTCYVPFKFAGIGGVAIADFRAMSQETFWSGQPQHDNLAGHSFLSFYDGEKWQHSKYVSTVYRSTGPNWYDIQINYISADSSIKITADIWETPQVDELRSFFNVKYEVLKALSIEDAQAHFRFLNITSRIQSLKFTGFAASGSKDLEIDFARSPFPVKGHRLPSENAFLAVFGDSIRERGSNAIVIRSFSGPEGIGPAATLQTGPYRGRFEMDREEDTRLLLVPDRERLELKEGDLFEINGFWLPYGTRDGVDTPRREAELYGSDSPKITSCRTGTPVSNLPVIIRAKNNRAEFSLKGGKDLVPVVISGLTKWEYPRIWKKEGSAWRLLSHSRNTEHDGYQVFSEEGGTFGAVFLVHSDENEQTLKVQSGKKVDEAEKIELGLTSEEGIPAPLTLKTTEGKEGIKLKFPATDLDSKKAGDPSAQWKQSEGNSLWFESSEGNWIRGGRINPNQDDLDLEYWWRNLEQGVNHASPEFFMDVLGTPFEDREGARTWILTSQGWVRGNSGLNPEVHGLGAIAIESSDGGKILCMAWPKSSKILCEPGQSPGIALEAVSFGLNKRYHTRGKIYLLDGDLEVLRDRILKEIAPITRSDQATVR